ncbi:unnamed protein product [Gordionus sp. m RMFG-2023]|uniref:cohesin subunit SA-2-like isoform X1 n=1 Tax=Gordionus sp. m RMFG-2023 TaxID=3053472 RepID=UPI0030DF03C4
MDSLSRTRKKNPNNISDDEMGDNLLNDDILIDDNEISKRGKKRTKEDTPVMGSTGKRILNRSGPGRPRKQNSLPVDPASSLFEIVKQGRSSFQAVVDEWIEKCKKDKMVAVGNLMQFFVDSSGCKGKITQEMQTTMEHSDIIRKMTEQFDEDSGDYPIISGGIFKRFRINFCDFVQILIKQCQYSIIFDPYVIDNILHFLIGLADSQVRAFRHTSTLTALKIMSALVDVVLNINTNIDYTIRQFETEKQKCQGKRPTERLEMLTQKKQETEENMNDVCTQLSYIFRSIFVHRYRDTIPDVRALCMQEIGIWMKKFPKMFLDDSYLKYIGWTLYDKVGEVRLKCLLSLQPLYASEELTVRLELFTNKFKDRIIAMTLDKEYEVAVQAVKLINNILKFHREILTDRDCEHVYELVYSIHRQVAQAAGEFLKERLFTLDEEAMGKSIKTKRGKKRLPNTPLVRDLVQFFIESELHEHGAYLVDSLIETNDMIKDWECMTDLLIEEPGRGEEALDNNQETSLIEIMTCCVKQAATGEAPVGRTTSKKGHLSAKENKLLQEERSKLTEHFIIALPSLLAKYIADPEKISNLMLIPQYFDLDLYTSNRCEKYLEYFLKYAEEIMLKHMNPDVLSTCAKTYELLCLEENSINGRCRISKSTLIDNLVERFKITYEEFMQEKEEPDEDQIFALLSSLKRLSSFNEFHDITNWDLWDYLITILKYGCDVNRKFPISQDILCKALSCAHFHLLWYLNNINNVAMTSKKASIEDKNNLESHDINNLSAAMIESIKTLKSRLCDYITFGQELMYAGSYLEEDIYLSICDLLIAFNRHISYINPTLEHIIFEPDKNLITQLNSFIIEKVFINISENEEEFTVGGHGKIEQLRKGRNFLASFCKLIIYNVISIQNAVDIFRNYTKFYTDYGDIIKMTIGKAREINKVSCAKVMITALQYHFKDMFKLSQNELLTSHNNLQSTEASGNINVLNLIKTNSWHEGFSSLKELGRRFCLSFGLDQIKNREAIALIHKEGIIFSLSSTLNNMETVQNQNYLSPPHNLYFLDVVGEFSNKLMKQDKRTVLTFLDRHLSPGTLSYKGDEWQPLFNYRNSLLQNIDIESHTKIRSNHNISQQYIHNSPLALNQPNYSLANNSHLQNTIMDSFAQSIIPSELHPIYEHEEEMAEIGEKDLNMFLGNTNLPIEEAAGSSTRLRLSETQQQNQLQNSSLFQNNNNLNNLTSFVMNTDMSHHNDSLDQIPPFMM